ncbi:MAG TPA: DUF4347 domain-containing protein [Desulfobacterales bacterium]|nr:DUF4347 domain-containing protein [Desulfobacterales bacterium]
MTTVHLWADIPGDWRPSGRRDAELHAGGQTGHSVARLTCLNDLIRVLRDIRDAGKQIDEMDFHTHGSAGSINLGRDRLNRSNTANLAGQGFENIFRAAARIIFWGCNVATGAIGELFLVGIGVVLLRARGGQVRGASAPGVRDVFLTGVQVHPTGRWKTAQVRPGGLVDLRNHEYLIPGRISGRIRAAETALAGVERRITGTPAIRGRIFRIRLRLAQVRSLQPAGARPRYFNLYQQLYSACSHLDWAERDLARLRIHLMGEAFRGVQPCAP